MAGRHVANSRYDAWNRRWELTSSNTKLKAETENLKWHEILKTLNVHFQQHFPPTKPHLIILPKQEFHQLGTKYTNIGAHGGESHSRHRWQQCRKFTETHTSCSVQSPKHSHPPREQLKSAGLPLARKSGPLLHSPHHQTLIKQPAGTSSSSCSV